MVFTAVVTLGGQRSAQPAATWLSLCGQCLNPDIISKSGIGTSHAVAEARVTRAGAKAWCENWQPGRNVEECVKEQLSSDDAKKSYRATADCNGGRIAAIDGKTYSYAGTRTNDVGKGRSKWRDAAGAIVGQDEGSGGLAIAQQWEVLCPTSLTGKQPIQSPDKSK
jgi:hypothetical protein